MLVSVRPVMRGLNKMSVPRSSRCPSVSVSGRTPGLCGYLTNTCSERASASVSLKPAEYFIQARAETVCGSVLISQLHWWRVLLSLWEIRQKNSSILYVCSVTLGRWVAQYFLSLLLIFNINTYNKLSPKANYEPSEPSEAGPLIQR